jgi:predicted Rossmann fold flavoprotein
LIQVLRTECDWAGVSFQLKTSIEQVTYKDDHYRLETSQGVIETQKLVVATGGLSFPKLKATGFGYQLAQQFGLPVLPQRPGLVPLLLPKSWQNFVADLSGVSLEVEACAGGRCFQEPMLFTHFGLSGPAILQVSNYWQKGEPLRLNLLPQIGGKEAVFAELKALKQAGGKLERWLQAYWPKRLIKAWLKRFPLSEAEEASANLAEVRDEALLAYAQPLTEWTLYPPDTAGYDKAEVTLGGVDTDAVSSKTFEAKRQPGLYFIGEVLDVTGHLGGYNFQWAWSSGVACGLACEGEKK